MEHILTDLIFINNGKVALDCGMDEVENNYVELMVAPANAAAARQLGPLNERELFGRHIFLYRGLKRELLEDLGELRTPSVADLFVATLSGEPS